MGFLIFRNKYFVFPVGVIYFWSILIFLATKCIPGLANQLIDVSTLNSSARFFEGSAQGSFIDILGIDDDDDDDATHDDVHVNDMDENTGDFKDLNDKKDRESVMLPGAIREDRVIHSNSKGFTVQCFRCHGHGVHGCDVTSMMSDFQKHLVWCETKCLNVSSGTTAVYDCANDMLTHMDHCLHNDGTEMCFCSGHFCNGPPIVQELVSIFKPPFTFPKLPPSLEDNEIDNNIDGSSYELLKNNNKSKNGTIFQNVLNETNNEHHLFSANKTGNNSAEDNSTDTVLSEILELFSQNKTHFSKDNLPFLENIHKIDINFNISQSISSVSKKSSRNKGITSRAIDINELRVGNLKDSSEENNSGCRFSQNRDTHNIILTFLSIMLVCKV